MQILRRLPFEPIPSSVEVAGETIPIRAFQIIVWVSLSVGETLAPDAPRFPAVLDTGHSHNFSIRERQLRGWAGLESTEFSKLGAIMVNELEVPLFKARLWIHRNRPGTKELLPKPFAVTFPEGMSMYPTHLPSAPRLPLVGIRGLMRERLRLVIDEMAVWLSEHPKNRQEPQNTEGTA